MLIAACKGQPYGNGERLVVKSELGYSKEDDMCGLNGLVAEQILNDDLNLKKKASGTAWSEKMFERSLAQHESFLWDIFKDKDAACWRHKLYKKKGKARASLAHHHLSYGLSDDMMDAIDAKLISVFGKRFPRGKYDVYIKLVLVPEFLAAVFGGGGGGGAGAGSQADDDVIILSESDDDIVIISETVSAPPLPTPRHSVKVVGLPLAEKRPRVGRYGNVYSPSGPARKAFAEEMKSILSSRGGELLPFVGAVAVKLLFTFSLPTSAAGAGAAKVEQGHICKPDVDNLIKFALDACNGVLYGDDKQVVEIYAKKVYGDVSSTFIEVTKIM